MFDLDGAVEGGSLSAAANRVDITPTSLTGLYPIGGGSFTAVHDRLFMRTLLVGDSDGELVIISLDLIEVGDTTEIRHRIEQELGIPSHRVLICATHTHSAPRLGEVSPGAIAHELSPEGAIYTAWVHDQMVAAVRDAQASAQPARIGVGSCPVDINVNRDQYLGGEYRLGVDPGGPSDKTLWVVDVQTRGGEPIAALMAYSVHPTLTLGARQISGDLAGAAERYLEAQLGGGAVGLWAGGAIGDQAARAMNRASASPDREHDHNLAFELAEAYGVSLGAAALSARGAIGRHSSSARIATRELIADLPAKHREVVDIPTIRQQRVETVRLRMNVVVIGTLALVGIGGEVVVPLAALARAASPLTNTILLSLVNDRLGYLPEDAAYPRNTFAVRGSPIRAGYAERTIVEGVADTVTDLLERRPTTETEA